MPTPSKDLRKAWLDWLSLLEVENAVGGTITFKRSRKGNAISADEAAKALQLFHTMLDRKAYGNRAKKDPSCRLVFVAVNEGGREYWQKHPHAHFYLEVPQNYSDEDWMSEVSKVFRKIRCFGEKNCEVKPVIDEGWLDYMFKLDTKSCYADDIDVLSLWTKSWSA